MTSCQAPSAVHGPAAGNQAGFPVWDGPAALRRLVPTYGQPANGRDRRRDRRYPYSQWITLYPLNPDYSPRDGGPLTVLGKDISEGGLSFYHTAAVPFRHAIADLVTPGGSRLALLVDLKWCRFTSQGWYENGGRFLQVIDVGDEKENPAHPENIN